MRFSKDAHTKISATFYLIFSVFTPLFMAFCLCLLILRIRFLRKMFSPCLLNGIPIIGFSIGLQHKVDRVLGFFSSLPNWDPLPHPEASVSPPWFWGEGHTRLRDRGWVGGPNSDEGTVTVIL
jgi:hypothetical protein